jgi:phenylalanyl-tRNA synthetase beta chain
LPWSELRDAIEGVGGGLLESVQYLDTFQGGNLGDSLESVHLGMTFRDRERTLTGEQVDQLVNRIVAVCESRFSAKLRT